MDFFNLMVLVLCLNFNFLIVTASPEVSDQFLYGKFPDNFMWGLATSAYQIEGGWNADGKGKSNWDLWSHEDNGSNIVDSKNGDIACDSYNKYLEDVKLLKGMGAQVYRFSLSWSRVIPTGVTDGTTGINQAGIIYYNNLINALIDEDIIPFVTLYHWDIPMGIHSDGGWLNETTVDHFANYSRVAFNAFGDRVKNWLSFSEPYHFCLAGWTYDKKNHFEDLPVKPYICAHNIIKAHGKSWRIHDEEFRPAQKGQMGISLDYNWSEPKNRSDPEHIKAMDRALNFRFGWWAHPLTKGVYPPIMRELVDSKSPLNASRLPTFDETWTKIINGSLDFLGLNHYSTSYVLPSDDKLGLDGDANIRFERDTTWNSSGIGWSVVPSGFRKIITWVSKEYSLPVYITENGYGGTENEGMEDTGRINYYRAYINEALKSIRLDGADVRSYIAWSLMDNYEWDKGYTVKFGVNYVDFNDPGRKRTPKRSATELTKIFSDNGFPEPPNSS